MKLLKQLTFALILLGSLSLQAQTNKSNPDKVKSANFPESFTISKPDFDLLLTKKANSSLELSSNKFLDKSTIEMNSINGDIHFLRLKLSYFSNSYMLVQINGIYSTQVFILSKDKSVFYKGKIEKDFVFMSKCAEDEIVSE